MCHRARNRKHWGHESRALNVLIGAGAGLNARDKHGATPVHHFLTWVQSAAPSTGVCGPLQRLMELEQDLDLTAKSYKGI